VASQFIQITLPDGTRKQVPAGCTVREALTPEGGRLDAKVLAAKINGEPMDLSRPLEQDATIEPLTFESAEGREVYRHSSTHIMAQAVKDAEEYAPEGNEPIWAFISDASTAIHKATA